MPNNDYMLGDSGGDEKILSSFLTKLKGDKFVFLRGKFSNQVDYLDNGAGGSRDYPNKKLIELIENIITEVNGKPQYSLNHFPEQVKDVWETILSQAIIFLKWTDEREQIHDWGDYGITELREYFDKFYEFEQLLYGSDKFYRDHMVHSLRVYLLGHYLYTLKKMPESYNYLNFKLPIEISLNKEIKTISPKKAQNEFKSVISEYLLKKRERNDNYNKQAKKELIMNDELELLTNHEKEAIWAIIALTHDLGYPIEKIDEINPSINDILHYFGKINFRSFTYYFPFQSQYIHDFIIKLISSEPQADITSLSEEVRKATLANIIKAKDNKELLDSIEEFPLQFNLHYQPKYYLKFSRSFEEMRHGIISCILLMKQLIYFQETDFCLSSKDHLHLQDAIQYDIRRTILRSIASHDTEYIYHTRKENFSYFLIICDDLQIWGRPYSKEQKTSSKTKTEVDLTGLQVTALEIPTIKINFTLSDEMKPRWNIEDQYKISTHEDIFNYFILSCKKILKISRAAVDVGKQNLCNLSFFDKTHEPDDTILFSVNYRFSYEDDDKISKFYLDAEIHFQGEIIPTDQYRIIEESETKLIENVRQILTDKVGVATY